MLEESSIIQEPKAQAAQQEASPSDIDERINENKGCIPNEDNQQNHISLDSRIKKKKMKYSNQIYIQMEPQQEKQQDHEGNNLIGNNQNIKKDLDNNTPIESKEQKTNEAGKPKQSKLSMKILSRNLKQRNEKLNDQILEEQDTNHKNNNKNDDQTNRKNSKGRTSNSASRLKQSDDAKTINDESNQQDQQQQQLNANKNKGDNVKDKKKKEKKPLNEKERLREAGFYTKINYNLSEIIQNKTLSIKIETASNVKLQKDIESQVYSKGTNNNSNNKKDKNKKDSTQEQLKKEQGQLQQQENKDEDQNVKVIKGLEVEDDSPKGNILTKKKRNRRAKTRGAKDKDIMDKIIEISAGGDNLVKINELESSLNVIKESKNVISAGWDSEILSEEQLKKRDQDIQNKESKLRQLKDEIAKSQADQIKKLEDERIEREKKRLEKKKQRLGHLVNISKILIQAKQARGIPNPKLLKVTKYKAVPAGQLDFELIVKKKKKISRIKNALIAYLSKKNKNKNNKGQQEREDNQTEDCYETINEDEDEENEDVEEAKNLNSSQQQIYKEDDILKSQQNQQDAGVIIHRLPTYIDENHNLGGVKYNNMILRDWVDHLPSTSIENMTLELINGLSYSQAMKKLNQPKKAKKRIVAGFKEVLGSLQTTSKERMSKCIIVALNLQQSPLEYGTDQAVLEILTLAETKHIPVIHASTRSKLGKAFTGKFGPRVSIASIINHEGFQEQFQQLLECVQVAREELKDKLEEIIKAKIIKDESKSSNKKQKKNENMNDIQSGNEKLKNN